MHLKSKFLVVFSFFVISLLITVPSMAHEPDHTYLYLRVYKDQIGGRVEVTAADMNKVLGTTINTEIQAAEVEPLFERMKNVLAENIAFGADNKDYVITFTESKILKLDEEDDFIEFHFELTNVADIPDELKITYNPFFDQSPNHKGMLIIEYNWKAGIIANYSNVAEIFTASNRSVSLSLKDTSIWRGFWAMIKLGIWHIWIGLDHILFLVALVLPSVVRRKNQRDGVDVIPYVSGKITEWNPVRRFKPAALYILKIVTFFTIAHSITLAIASLQIFTIPSRYVESIIAFSIAMAAFHNIIPIFKTKEWVVAFAFGLFHGFGFASVLGEKGLGGDYMILSLLGFNGGVEIGQIAIIAAIFPVLFFIRKFSFYPAFLKYGSVLLILISLHWSIERFFEVNLSISRTISSVFGQVYFLF